MPHQNYMLNTSIDANFLAIFDYVILLWGVETKCPNMTCGHYFFIVSVIKVNVRLITNYNVQLIMLKYPIDVINSP